MGQEGRYNGKPYWKKGDRVIYFDGDDEWLITGENRAGNCPNSCEDEYRSASAKSTHSCVHKYQESWRYHTGSEWADAGDGIGVRCTPDLDAEAPESPLGAPEALAEPPRLVFGAFSAGDTAPPIKKKKKSKK